MPSAGVDSSPLLRSVRRTMPKSSSALTTGRPERGVSSAGTSEVVTCRMDSFVAIALSSSQTNGVCSAFTYVASATAESRTTTIVRRFFPLAHPTSFAITEGDPALMCWTLQWVSRALVHDPGHLFAGNMFFPYHHAVLMSDSMLSLAVLNAPIRVFTANPWIGYNLLIVLAYYLSCVSGAWLARELTGSDVASVWAGVFWGFLFFRVHHIGHPQIFSYQAIPAVAAASLRFWKQPTTNSALLVAVLFVAQ